MAGGRPGTPPRTAPAPENARNLGSGPPARKSTGLSLLDPKLTVYAGDQTTVLGTATGSGEQGNTLTVTVTGISAGQQFYVKVAGAVTTSMCCRTPK